MNFDYTGITHELELLDQLIRLARIGAALERLPQGVHIARHGALGATKWCVESTEPDDWSVDGDTALDALTNAEPWLAPLREDT